jgi:hypothetical protein
MANLAWDVIKAHPVILSGAVNSDSFVMPRAATSMTVHLPATMTGITLTVQSLDPQDSTTWNTVNFVSLTSPINVVALTVTFGAARCVVFPIDIYGGGNLRLVSGTAEAADRTFSVMFTKSA